MTISNGLMWTETKDIEMSLVANNCHKDFVQTHTSEECSDSVVEFHYILHKKNHYNLVFLSLDCGRGSGFDMKEVLFCLEAAACKIK